MSETQILDDVHEANSITFSSESLQVQSEEEVCVRYITQPSGYGDPSLEISQEPPKHVHIPEASLQDYSDVCCCRICKPKAGYYKEVIAIREYRRLLQKDYDEIFKLMDWFELPGNEHEKVKGHNYLSCQLWLYSFAAVNIQEEEKQKEHFIREHYEDAMITAEETGMILRHYLKPLEKITAACTFLENMSKLIDARMHVPGVKNISSHTGTEFIQKTVLRGNRINDFSKLHIYTRDQSKIQWSEFRALSFQHQLTQITKGLDQFINKVRSIRLLLEGPLAHLKKANFNLFSREPSLIPHIKRMYIYLKKIFTNEEVRKTDEELIKALFLEINTHVLYIVQTGRELIKKVWEIVLMTRLCYTYVKDSSTSHVPLTNYEVILNQKFKKNVKYLLKPSTYEPEDFFLTSCPDVIRKVPIVINNKTELALHYEGHQNSVKSSGKQSPASRSSQGRVKRKSVGLISQVSQSLIDNNPVLLTIKKNNMRDSHSVAAKRRSVSVSRRRSSVK